MKMASGILVLTLFILSGSLIAQDIKTTETEVHYYLYEFTNGDDSCAVIIEVATDQPESPGPEFTEVTKEVLQEKGYYSTPPSQLLTDYSFGHSSGITRTFRGGSTTKRRITCQSETNRTNSVGYNYVYGETWRNNQLMYKLPRRAYGLWIRYTYIYTWDSSGPPYYWEQKGWHKWETNFPIDEAWSSAQAYF